MNKTTIIFVINGEDVTVEANLNQPLRAARNKALDESSNTGRPKDEWEVRTEAGVLLNPDTKLKNLELQPGARLFLSLQIGVGG